MDGFRWHAFAAGLAGAFALGASATENANSNKPPGVDTVAAGLMHDGGWRITTTVSQYVADENRDGSGSKPGNVSDFYFRAQVLSIRFQYVWPDVKWLGASVETRFGHLLYGDVKFRADVRVNPNFTARPRGSDHGALSAGFAGPVMLGWKGETVHQVFGPLLLYPTRSFDKSQTTNLSTGYRSFVPFYGITWFPSEGWEASAAATILFNQANSATGYRSGREALVDFGADKVVMPGLRVGLSGYAYKQLKDDVLNGVTVAGGNRGQVFALGPQVRYRVSKYFGITFKWQPEFKAENRPVGNRAFIQFFNEF
ncbi:MAG: transporter [Betaproteobacteria bacterium]|nr:transporter [Betaproteobacteria bacterium]